MNFYKYRINTIPTMLLFALVIFLAVITCTLLVSTPRADALSGSSFKAGKIIDDGIFFNKNSMSLQNIQAFLNAKVPVCDTWGTKMYNGQTRAQYGSQHDPPAPPPYTCLKDYRQATPSMGGESGLCNALGGGTKSGAQIIYDVAQACGVNPQVLLVLLQKEQSLVTEEWPFPVQYQKATGFNCPDTAPCDPQFAGYFYQVYYAARQYKKYARDANGYNYKAARNNNILWNPVASCGSSTVYIENQATAGLYIYTPYRPNQAALNNLYGTGDACSSYGNRNFWRMFSDWFGSTDFPQPAGALLYKSTSTGKVYLVNNNTRFYISSWDMMTNYRLDAFGAIPVEESTLNQLANGGNLTSLFWNDNGVFLVNNGQWSHVSGAMCTAWAVSCFDSSQVKAFDNSFTNNHLAAGIPLPEVATMNGITYKLENGYRLPIANPSTFSSLGYNWNQVITANAANITQPLGNLLITTPATLRFAPSAKVYYFDGQKYHHVPSPDIMRSWGFDKKPVLEPQKSAYNTTAPTEDTPLSIWVQDGTGRYVVDGGRRITLDANGQATWSGAVYQSFSAQLARTLPSTPIGRFTSSNSAIYLLEGGKKRHVPTYDDYLALGFNASNTVVLSPSLMSLAPAGQPALGDGAVISISGDSKIYVVSNNSLLHVPNPATFDAFHFNWSNIRGFDASIKDAYPISGDALTTTVKTSQGYSYAKGNKRITVSSQQANDLGLNATPYKTVGNGVLSNLPSQSVTRFIYNADDGRIYYGSGGALHYVSTYEAYIGYGGGSIPTTTADNAFVQTFAIGQPV